MREHNKSRKFELNYTESKVGDFYVYEQASVALETSLFLDFTLCETSFMTPSTYVLDSSYYTKLELQNYFLIPQLNDKHFEFNNTLLTWLNAQLLHSQGVLSEGTCLLTMPEGWPHMEPGFWKLCPLEPATVLS